MKLTVGLDSFISGGFDLPTGTYKKICEQNLQTGVVSGEGDLSATNKILVGSSVVLIICAKEKI
jgi:hypothetical protein